MQEKHGVLQKLIRLVLQTDQPHSCDDSITSAQDDANAPPSAVDARVPPSLRLGSDSDDATNAADAGSVPSPSSGSSADRPAPRDDAPTAALFLHVAAALAHLSAFPRARAPIVEAGGVEALVRLAVAAVAADENLAWPSPTSAPTTWATNGVEGLQEYVLPVELGGGGGAAAAVVCVCVYGCGCGCGRRLTPAGLCRHVGTAVSFLALTRASVCQAMVQARLLAPLRFLLQAKSPVRVHLPALRCVATLSEVPALCHELLGAGLVEPLLELAQQPVTEARLRAAYTLANIAASSSRCCATLLTLPVVVQLVRVP